MKVLPLLILSFLLFTVAATEHGGAKSSGSSSSQPTPTVFWFRNAEAEIAQESRFLGVPDPKLAEQHLRILTQAPHVAGTPEDKATADYVAQKFREAGLEA